MVSARAWNPADSTHSGQRIADLLHIFPDRSFIFGRAQQSRRVVSDNERHTPVIVEYAAQFADTLRGIEQVLGGDTAECTDEFGSDQANLSFEVRHATDNLVRSRIAVLRRTTFQYVADVHIVACKVYCGKNPIEQLTGTAYKRFALDVLFTARCLTDQHEPGMRVSGAEYRVGARPV